MASKGMPFVGLVSACVDPAGDGRAREAALGPIRARVMARFAKGDRRALDDRYPRQVHDRAPMSMLFKVLPMLLLAKLRGDGNRGPFFDAKTGEPAAVPHLLSADEIRTVETARDA